jgi:hypothetical protein
MPISTVVGVVKKQPRKLKMTPEAKLDRLKYKKKMANVTERSKLQKQKQKYYKKNKTAILKRNKNYREKAKAVGR